MLGQKQDLKHQASTLHIVSTHACREIGVHKMSGMSAIYHTPTCMSMGINA
jgi:hypothetical protein